MAEVWEGSLVCAHEAGHALVNLVLLGNPGRVSLSPQGGSQCSRYWDQDLKLDQGCAADLVHQALGAAAGMEAERLLHGYVGLVSTNDEVELRTALAHLPQEGLSLKRSEVELVVRHLLRVHQRCLGTLAAELGGGSLSNSKAKQALLRNDHHQILLSYADAPLLQGRWWPKWEQLHHQARHLSLLDVNAPNVW
jgi:hypothetical protein